MYLKYLKYQIHVYLTPTLVGDASPYYKPSFILASSYEYKQIMIIWQIIYFKLSPTSLLLYYVVYLVLGCPSSLT